MTSLMMLERALKQEVLGFHPVLFLENMGSIGRLEKKGMKIINSNWTQKYLATLIYPDNINDSAKH